jgi:hypothetical protein
MKTLIVSALALLLLTGVGFSQAAIQPGENANNVAAKMDAEAARAAQEEKKQRELDAAYKDALARTKPPPSHPDPWGTVRPANGSAASHQ